jgi:hypothetical protein
MGGVGRSLIDGQRITPSALDVPALPKVARND